jgi:hypothetical protein
MVVAESGQLLRTQYPHKARLSVRRGDVAIRSRLVVMKLVRLN